MIRILIMWLCLLAVGWPLNALADALPCTEQDAKEAESEVSTVKSWPEAHRQFLRYAQCDDGAIAEGFSNSLSQLLAKHWRHVAQLARFTRSDPAFYKFVIRHIDETLPEDRLMLIANNARSRCPRGLKKICRDLIRATSSK